MASNRGTQLRNDVIASTLVAVVARNKTPKRLLGELESSLNTLLPSRRAKAASRILAVARTGDKKTSVEAAALVNVPKAEARVLRQLHRFAGSLTKHDIAQMIGTQPDNISPRMKPLVRKGLIDEVGVDRSAGRGRTLYQITPAGRAFLAQS